MCIGLGACLLHTVRVCACMCIGFGACLHTRVCVYVHAVRVCACVHKLTVRPHMCEGIDASSRFRVEGLTVLLGNVEWSSKASKGASRIS